MPEGWLSEREEMEAELAELRRQLQQSRYQVYSTSPLIEFLPRCPRGEAQLASANRTTAEEKAAQLLEAKIGADAMAKIAVGGAYPVPSRHWPGVLYYVPRSPYERIRVMVNGAAVVESCLVTTDSSLPWPDVMLQRILAIEADETIVINTGVVYDQRSEEQKRNIRQWFGSLVEDVKRAAARVASRAGV